MNNLSISIHALYYSSSLSSDVFCFFGLGSPSFEGRLVSGWLEIERFVKKKAHLRLSPRPLPHHHPVRSLRQHLPRHLLCPFRLSQRDPEEEGRKKSITCAWQSSASYETYQLLLVIIRIIFRVIGFFILNWRVYEMKVRVS